jgi:hypothetical protein
MAFKNLLSLKKENEKQTEVYFAAEICDESVKVALWQVVEGQVEIIRTSDVIEINGKKLDDFLHAVDMAIATASEEGDPEPDKVIFGLPEEWVDEKGIVVERRGLLKFISSKLELKPIGFVVIQDALITYLRQKQSTPPSAIFIRFQDKALNISLVRLGKVIKQEKVGRSDDLIADVKEGLVRFKKQDQLPSRLILYNGYLNFEDIKQQLLAYDWEKDFPFSHTPEIEALSREMTVEAVALAGGKEAVKLLGLETDQKDQVTQIEETTDEKIKEKESDLPEGFAVGQNDELESEIEEQAKEPVVKDAQGEDVVFNEEEKKEEVLEQKKSDKNFLSKIKQKTMPIFSKIMDKLPIKKTKKAPELGSHQAVEVTSEDFSKPKTKKLPLAVIIGIALLVLAGIVFAALYYYWNVPKAEVILFIRPKKVEKQVEITVSTEAQQLDEENFIVPGQIKEITVEGSETVPTTGTVRVGESAKGKVTIYNKTDENKKFDKGTILVGPGNLRYLLDEEVEVEAQVKEDTGDGETVTFGKKEANIIAGDIGDEYNIEADQGFTFKEFDQDDFVGKNSDKISGGESKEIQAVSKDDRINARDLLQQKLEEQAKQKVQSEIGSDVVVVSQSQESELGDTVFDKKVGEEGDSLTVDGEMEVQVFITAKSDFNQILLKALAASIPENFILSESDLKTTISEAEEDEEETILTIDARANVMPKFNFAQIKQNITGKKIKAVEEYFRSLSNFDSSKITINPQILGKFGTMPKKSENIAITITETTQ